MFGAGEEGGNAMLIQTLLLWAAATVSCYFLVLVQIRC
jgi:hypothetical protein